MGGSEKKSRKRLSPSSESAPEGESKSKKHRTRDEKERSSSSSKRDKRDDTKEKRSHKHSKHSHHSADKGKKSEDKHDRKRSKNNSHLAFPELSSEDYFSKNNEFATWLKEKKKIFFSDLSSEDARNLFSDFIKKWNKGKLESQYYEGITSGPRTAHNWKIKGK